MLSLRLVPESGAPIELPQERIVLGREATCQVFVDDRSVSRRHAVIERRGEAWAIIDSGSANGTFINDYRIGEAGLVHGQELRLGTVRFRVEIEDAESTVLMSGSRSTAAAPPEPAAPEPIEPVAVPPADERPPASQPASPAPALPELTEAELADLPSAHPVMAADAMESMIRNAVPRARVSGGDDAAPQAEAGLTPMATFLSSVAIILTGVTIFFMMSAGKLRQKVEEDARSPELVAARMAAETYRTTEALVAGGALRNGRLVLCNDSTHRLEVLWLGSVFLPPSAEPKPGEAPQYKLATFNSSFCGPEHRMILEPGAQKSFTVRSATVERCSWDGSALFYAFAVRRPPSVALAGQPADSSAGANVWFSGVRSSREECVRVGGGW